MYGSSKSETHGAHNLHAHLQLQLLPDVKCMRLQHELTQWGGLKIAPMAGGPRAIIGLLKEFRMKGGSSFARQSSTERTASLLNLPGSYTPGCLWHMAQFFSGWGFTNPV